jgi:hypothetical protein
MSGVQEIDPADAPLEAVAVYGTRLRATAETINGLTWWTVHRDDSRSEMPNPDPWMRDEYGGTELWRETDDAGVRWRLTEGIRMVYLSGFLAEEGPCRLEQGR